MNPEETILFTDFFLNKKRSRELEAGHHTPQSGWKCIFPPFLFLSAQKMHPHKNRQVAFYQTHKFLSNV